MRPLRRPFWSVLRTAWWAMLVLGLVLRPVLSQKAEAHVADHAIHALAHAGAGVHEAVYDHGHDDARDDDDHARDAAPAASDGAHEHGAPDDGDGDDHASGTHALMHQAGAVAMEPIAVVVMLEAVPRPALHLRLAVADPPSGLRPPPFRPPIA